MPHIPPEEQQKFEDAIYFPILITVLENDLKAIQDGPFKLKGPYIKLVEGALKLIRLELKDTNIYMRRNKMKLVKGKNDGMFTEYIVIHNGFETERRYLNVRLRNRTEELMTVYFDKSLEGK